MKLPKECFIKRKVKGDAEKSITEHFDTFTYHQDTFTYEVPEEKIITQNKGEKMKKLMAILGKARVLYVLAVFCALFLLLGGKMAYSEDNIPNPAEELISWTFEQNVGLTYMYDLDKKINLAGGKWQLYKSEHNWIYFGICATQNSELGGYISFNLGKGIEKIKGEPLVYLKHLEVGYFYVYDFHNKETRDGIILNIIKIGF